MLRSNFEVTVACTVVSCFVIPNNYAWACVDMLQSNFYFSLAGAVSTCFVITAHQSAQIRVDVQAQKCTVVWSARWDSVIGIGQQMCASWIGVRTARIRRCALNVPKTSWSTPRRPQITRSVLRKRDGSEHREKLSAIARCTRPQRTAGSNCLRSLRYLLGIRWAHYFACMTDVRNVNDFEQRRSTWMDRNARLRKNVSCFCTGALDSGCTRSVNLRLCP